MEQTPDADGAPAVQPPIGGRKPLPDYLKRKRRLLWLTDAEWEKVRAGVERMREAKPQGGAK